MKCPACGAALAAEDRFCQACGAPRRHLPADFAMAAYQCAALRARRDQGQLDDAAYEAALLGLAVQDEDGYRWLPGAASGEWYRYEGSQWVRRDPPLASAAPTPATPQGAPMPAPATPATPATPALTSPAAQPRTRSVVPGLLLVLGWTAGWAASFFLALALRDLLLPTLGLAYTLGAAGLVSGIIAALVAGPGIGRLTASRGALAAAVWAVAWTLGWWAAWVLGTALARAMTGDVTSLALAMGWAPAVAAGSWLLPHGLAGLAAGIVAGILAAPVLPRPERRRSLGARLGFLVLWPVLWAIGWIVGGLLLTALAAAAGLGGDWPQALGLVGGAGVGALLAGRALLGFCRWGARPAAGAGRTREGKGRS